MRKPRVGDIVHEYMSHPRFPDDHEPRAAIITKVPTNLRCAVDGPWVSLRIFTPAGETLGLRPFSETPKPGYWTWPNDAVDKSE